MEEILRKAQSYQYNSVMYKQIEDIEQGNVEHIVSEENFVFILEKHKNKIVLHWGAEDKEDFIKGIHRVMDFIEKNDLNDYKIVIEFVDEEFIKPMEALDFSIISEWVDYWIKDLHEINLSHVEFKDITLIREEEYQEAGKVLRSCEGYSRQFVGESDAWVKEWCEEDSSVIFVSKINNEVVGVCCLNIYGFNSEKGAVLWLREIAVTPKHQGKGIAYALIKRAIQWGIENGAKRSFLACDAENFNAIKLYKAFGYERKAERGQINMAKNL